MQERSEVLMRDLRPSAAKRMVGVIVNGTPSRGVRVRIGGEKEDMEVKAVEKWKVTDGSLRQAL